MNKPKKYFSQNYLKDILVKNKVFHYLNPSKNDVFVEIGPGKGELTKTLLKKTNQVNAVEIDKEMRSTIKTHYRKAKKLLKDNIKVLHEIAEVLIKEETIEGKRILELLGNKKPKVLQPQG